MRHVLATLSCLGQSIRREPIFSVRGAVEPTHLELDLAVVVDDDGRNLPADRFFVQVCVNVDVATNMKREHVGQINSWNAHSTFTLLNGRLIGQNCPGTRTVHQSLFVERQISVPSKNRSLLHGTLNLTLIMGFERDIQISHSFVYKHVVCLAWADY